MKTLASLCAISLLLLGCGSPDDAGPPSQADITQAAAKIETSHGDSPDVPEELRNKNMVRGRVRAPR